MMHFKNIALLSCLGLMSFSSTSFANDPRVPVSSNFPAHTTVEIAKPKRAGVLNGDFFYDFVVVPESIQGLVTFVTDPTNCVYGVGRHSLVEHADLLKASQKAGYDIPSLPEFYTMVLNHEFPPAAPDLKTIRFLSNVDLTLDWHMQWLAYLIGTTDESKKIYFSKETNNRLVALLQYLYPDDIVSYNGTTNGKSEGSFSFDGTSYKWTSGIGGIFLTLEPGN